MKIKAERVFIEGQFKSALVTIEQDRIAAIASAKDSDSYDFKFGAEYCITPGLIDLHIHGAKGADIMDATPEALKTISEALAEEGVTGFLATTMTESQARITAALENVHHFMAQKPAFGAEVLGIHLEGPFLSRDYMGAQCGDALLNPDITLLTQWQQHAIRLLTLAPELHNAQDFIKKARSLGIVISIGHTAATFDETIAGINAGARYATHLFNAMSGVHHRTPGAAAAILMDDRVVAELVADGHHVAPSMLKFAALNKGLHKIVLVTDAMRAKCLKNGEYDLGGQVVVVKDGAARLQKNGVLAGSVLRLNGALRNFIEYTNYSLEECIPLVTETPAKVLGLQQEIGTLTSSKKANLVVFNSELNALLTLREGQVIYNRN